MPYLRKQVDPMRQVLTKYEMTPASLARVIGAKSSTTGRSRMKDPSTLTVAELRDISRKGHIPIDELRSAV